MKYEKHIPAVKAALVRLTAFGYGRSVTGSVLAREAGITLKVLHNLARIGGPLDRIRIRTGKRDIAYAFKG